MGCGCEAVRTTYYVIEVDRFYHGTNRPWYMAKGVGEITPRISEAWRSTSRAAADKLVGNEIAGKVIEYQPAKRGAARFVPDVVTKAKAADKRHGYFRPDDVFTVDAIHLSEEARKKLADRILDKADDPYVSVSLGTIKVAPSKNSYFGGELFAAVKEAIHRPHRFEARENKFVLI